MLVLAGFVPTLRADPREEGQRWQNQGYYWSLRGDRGQTDDNYQKAFAADPAGTGHHASYGWALYNLRDYEGALRVWREAFTGIDHNYASRFVCLALAHYRLGQASAAVDWYQMQCLAEGNYTSLSGMRAFTQYWQTAEQQAVEEIYHHWDRELSASKKLRARIRPKARAATPGDPGSDLQRRVDAQFVVELMRVKTIIRPTAFLELPVVIQADGSVATDPQQMEDAAYANPLLFAAAIRTLRIVAKPAGTPAAGSTEPAVTRIRFEFELAGDSAPKG